MQVKKFSNRKDFIFRGVLRHGKKAQTISNVMNLNNTEATFNKNFSLINPIEGIESNSRINFIADVEDNKIKILGMF